jgi:hypothetical protein
LQSSGVAFGAHATANRATANTVTSFFISTSSYLGVVEKLLSRGSVEA